MNIAVLHNHRNQQGAALLIFFLLLLTTGVVFFVSQLALDRGGLRYEDNTTEALARAKEALISHAVSFYQQGNEGLYGFLPCPETQAVGTEGNQQGNCTGQYINAIGRLPWRTLGIQPLKDGAGECLWYAVSGEYKFGNYNPGAPPPPSTRSEMHNADSPGMFRLLDENLNLVKGNLPEDRVVAVVIAPGPQLAGQNRPAANANLPCKVARTNADPAQYLEIVGGVDNSDVSAAVDSIDDFVGALNLQGANVNDRVLTITASEIFNAIRRQTDFNTHMHNLTEGLARCVAGYGVANVQSGGCDINVCRNQCTVDRNNCRDQCDVDRDACIAAGGSPPFCNWQRNTCRFNCNFTWFTCRWDCLINCGGPGGGPDVYRLPWPARVDLASDYRVSANYADIGAADVAAQGLLGRFPFDVGNSNAELIARGAPNNYGDEFLNNCTAVNVAGNTVTIDFSDIDNEYRRLYEHWKDHFFYVVSGAYAPDSGDNTCAANCPDSQGAVGNPYAAMVFFADEVLPTLNQLRRTTETDPGTPVAETKAVIDNYLEGSNAGNYPDTTGGGNYNNAAAPANDYYCLIDNDPPAFTVSCSSL